MEVDVVVQQVSEHDVPPAEQSVAESAGDAQPAETAATASQDQQDSTDAPASSQVPDEYREILGGTDFCFTSFIAQLKLSDIEIPDGVDPAFLAALPEDIRAEVIRDHIRQQRVQRATQRPAPQAEAAAAGEAPAAAEGTANPEAAAPPELDQEFLAALPPELQEEVLAQHEQRVAQQSRPQPAPAADVDPAALFDSLPPSLRAQVLADADDSVLQILPPNLVAEANRLRANLEQQVSPEYKGLLH